MAETGALVGIYGAIDQAVQTDPKLRAAVSRLLPLYRDAKLQWFDEFEEWLRARAEPARTPFPALSAALQELAESEPLGRMRPRRLFAIAVGMRAYPEMIDPNSALGGLALRALHVNALAGNPKKALALQALLAEEGSLSGAEEAGELSTWWNNLVTTAASDGLISDTSGMFPRPCSGQLLSMQNARGPIAALETVFETDQIDFDRAIRFLDPRVWPKCMPWFWCEMKRLGAGPLPGEHLYKEVVSSDCADKATAAFTAETELDFVFKWLPRKADPQAAFTNYWLGPGRPRLHDVIRVDEGSLVVAKIGAGQRPLRITTTKRIQFSYAFSSEALATMMCALGYTDAVGSLLFCAASGSKKDGNPFPGESTVENGPVIGPVPGGGGAVSDCIEECMAAAADCSRRMAEGTYTADELAQDITNTWGRILREGATAVELGARGSYMGARTRTRDRSGG